MGIPVVTHNRFRAILLKICTKETCHDTCADHWSPENPLWGHCAVVSVLAQKIFDGDVTAANIASPRRWMSNRHYRNILPDGTVTDFTRGQFGGRYPKLSGEKIITNSLVHIRIRGSHRYKLLEQRFLGHVKGMSRA